MPRIKPATALLAVALFSGAVLAADYVLDGGLSRGRYERVRPDRAGEVTIDVGDLQKEEVRFFRFLNAGNQEVRFFVARDRAGTVHSAFDANEICYKMKRGYRHEDGWMVCNKCDKAFRVTSVNEGGGGCSPVPVPHHLDSERLVLHEEDLLRGWRYFR